MYTKLYIENEIKAPTDTSNEVLKFTEECVSFWNKEGAQIYCENLLGNLGTKENNRFAKESKFDYWLLEAILIDIRTKEYIGVKVGRTSSHVWVNDGNERILMLHTNKNYK